MRLSGEPFCPRRCSESGGGDARACIQVLVDGVAVKGQESVGGHGQLYVKETQARPVIWGVTPWLFKMVGVDDAALEARGGFRHCDSLRNSITCG